ncbi:hypothetical protein V8B97DRAFT_2109878 [Scleroderma yunnanense]
METPFVGSLKWAPGFIGMAIGLTLYGVSIGQYLFYIQFFPNDHSILKFVVFTVFVLDSVNAFTLSSFYWRVLVTCRRDISYECTLGLPWDLYVVIVTMCSVAFCVQWCDAQFLICASEPQASLPNYSFYAHRVWIISDRNKPLFCAVLTFACAQFIFGMLFMAEGISTNNMAIMFNSWFCPLDSVSSAICDAIITISICVYLRPLRSSPFRKVHFIHHLHFIFVQMGTITCATALTMVIFYPQIQTSGTYLTIAPAGLLSKSWYHFTPVSLNLITAHSLHKFYARCRNISSSSTPIFQPHTVRVVQSSILTVYVQLPLYGVSIGQYLFYIRFFPNDYSILKFVVFMVFTPDYSHSVLDSVNAFTLNNFYWRVLVTCRRDTSYECTLGLPWDLYAAIMTMCSAACCVQCFYAHRVWIISNRNKPLLCAVVGCVVSITTLNVDRETARSAHFCMWPVQRAVSSSLIIPHLTTTAFGMCMYSIYHLSAIYAP